MLKIKQTNKVAAVYSPRVRPTVSLALTVSWTSPSSPSTAATGGRGLSWSQAGLCCQGLSCRVWNKHLWGHRWQGPWSCSTIPGRSGRNHLQTGHHPPLTQVTLTDQNSPKESRHAALALLLKKMKMKVLSHVRLFATPWTVAYQASPSMEFSRQEYWSGLPFPSPGDLPNPGMEPRSLAL